MSDWIESIPSAVKGHRQFLEWLVQHVRPAIVVELGVDYGYSAFVFERALASLDNSFSRVYGIDWFQGDSSTGFRDTRQAVMNKIEEHDLKQLTLVKGEFSEIEKVWTMQIGILFIDGSHDYKSVKEDFDKWSKHVHRHGVILMHDTNVPEFGVKQVFDEAQGYYKHEFLHSAGLGVLSESEHLIEYIKKF